MARPEESQTSTSHAESYNADNGGANHPDSVVVPLAKLPKHFFQPPFSPMMPSLQRLDASASVQLRREPPRRRSKSRHLRRPPRAPSSSGSDEANLVVEQPPTSNTSQDEDLATPLFTRTGREGPPSSSR